MSLDDLQAQLRGALDQQFATLKEQYEVALAKSREQARADVEQQAEVRIAAARSELETQMAAIVAATRAEAKQEAQATARLQVEQLEQQLQQQLEQTVLHAVNSVRRSSELELEAQRRRLEQDLQAERERGEAALETLRQASADAIGEERQRAASAATSAQASAAEESRRAQAGFDEERRRMEQALEEERERAAAELEAIKQLLETEITSAQSDAAVARDEAARAAEAADAAAAEAAAAVAEAAAAVAREERARAAESAATAAAEAATAAAAAAATKEVFVPAGSPALARVPEAIRHLDAAASLSQTLDALLQHAGAIAGRAALFLIDGDRLKAWKAADIPDIDVQTVESSIGGRDLLARAIQAGCATTASAELPAPPFARLTGGQAVAVPVMINDRAVAVLYADTAFVDGAAGWTEAVEAIVRYASAMSALRAAMRTLDVLRGDAPAAGNGNSEESARRFARLLVSEIKLYNEAAVRAGRQQRDLLQRLRAEIDRAQHMYQLRVPPAVGARDQYFHQELVQTLADGDPSLLGS